MTKRKKKEPPTGDDIQLEWQDYLGDGYVIDRSLRLLSTTGVMPWGDNPNFEWEGEHAGKPIKVILPRNQSERTAQIIGEIPNKSDPERGHTSTQLYEEIRRILRKIN